MKYRYYFKEHEHLNPLLAAHLVSRVEGDGLALHGGRLRPHHGHPPVGLGRGARVDDSSSGGAVAVHAREGGSLGMVGRNGLIWVKTDENVCIPEELRMSRCCWSGLQAGAGCCRTEARDTGRGTPAPIRGQYLGHVTNQRPVLRSQ